MFSLSGLMASVGDDNVTIQTIHQSMTEIAQTKRGDSRITFVTDVKADDVLHQRMVGVVIWIRREDINAYLQETGGTQLPHR